MSTRTSYRKCDTENQFSIGNTLGSQQISSTQLSFSGNRMKTSY
jgi:hypothetical protein